MERISGTTAMRRRGGENEAEKASSLIDDGETGLGPCHRPPRHDLLIDALPDRRGIGVHDLSDRHAVGRGEEILDPYEAHEDVAFENGDVVDGREPATDEAPAKIPCGRRRRAHRHIPSEIVRRRPKQRPGECRHKVLPSKRRARTTSDRRDADTVPTRSRP